MKTSIPKIGVLLALLILQIPATGFLHAEGTAQAPATSEVSIEALRRSIENLSASYTSRYPDGRNYLARLDELAAEPASPSRDEALHRLQREALLANPLLDFEQLLLVRRKANNLALPANWQSNSNLKKDGHDNDIAVLQPVSPAGELKTLYRPEGGAFVGDVDLHFEAGKMLFSMPSTAGKGSWQVFEIATDGTALRQVSQTTETHINNYDACYLPDGRVLFTSTAPCVAVPCVRGSSPVATLFRMNADGSDMRQLCFDQEHSWCPVPMPNGRILYSRWEYADLPHSNSRMLFTMNPDGTNQRAFYGSNSFWPNSVFYARPIPGHPSKFVGIVTGHHGACRTGEMVLFDTALGGQEAEGAVQKFPGYGIKVEAPIEDRLTETTWPKFLHPYPLSDQYFLVSMQPSSSANWGIYLVDVFDNMVLIKETPEYALLEPVPLRKTPAPKLIPDRSSPGSKDASVFLADIYTGPGLEGIPRGEVKDLRLYTFTFGYSDVGGLYGSIGMDGPWDMRRTLGTVPVESDGSAAFTIPANTPIAIQPLDREGKALQIMRSWFTAMPGEMVSCVGCHEKPGSAPPVITPIAARKKPSPIVPWRGPSRNYEFQREVQPVLDKFCISCHGGETTPDLRGTQMISGWSTMMHGNTGAETGGKFSVSYANLHRFVRRPGIESPMPLMTPMEFHADTTELVQMLEKDHHGVRLDAKAWDRLITWIDFNAPYHGRWSTIVGEGANQKEAQRASMRSRYANVDENHEDLPPPPATTISPINPKRDVDKSIQELPHIDGWPIKSPALAIAGRTLDLGDGVTMNFVYIPKGEFLMGSSTGYADESPVSHAVISDGFWMGKMEVSNQQFRRFDADHDSREEDRHGYQFGVPGYDVDKPDMPAVRLSWKQANAFCDWLSKRSGEEISLPTEAQWEWACRAGSETPFSYGGVDTDFSSFANMGDTTLSKFSGNPYIADFRKGSYNNPQNIYDNWIPQDARFDDGGFLSEPVGSYQPNAWGLHDMHGNVAEWTRSLYLPYPYREDDGRNRLDDTGKRVIRGGSWYDRPKRCTSSYRYGYRDYQKVYNVGFRVIISERSPSP